MKLLRRSKGSVAKPVLPAWDDLPQCRVAGRKVFLWNDQSLRSAAQQVDYDELLLNEVRGDHAVIRLWQNQDALVVSRQDGRSPHFQKACKQISSDGVSVVQRSTGGTAVAQLAGTVNLSLIYALGANQGFSIADSYSELVSPLVAYLRLLGLPAQMGEVSGAFCSGRYDVICDGQKLAGTAQRVKTLSAERRVLSHYTLNVANDVNVADALINRFYGLSGLERRILPGRASSVSDLLVAHNKQGIPVDTFLSGFASYLSSPDHES